MHRAALTLLLASTVSAHADSKTNQWKGMIFNVSDIALVLSFEATGNTLASPNGPIPTYLVNVKRFGDGYFAERCVINGSNLHIPVSSDGSGNCSTDFDYDFNLSASKLQVSFNGSFLDGSATTFQPTVVAVADCEKAS
jgi:hypothetical protein